MSDVGFLDFPRHAFIVSRSPSPGRVKTCTLIIAEGVVGRYHSTTYFGAWWLSEGRGDWVNTGRHYRTKPKLSAAFFFHNY